MAEVVMSGGFLRVKQLVKRHNGGANAIGGVLDLPAGDVTDGRLAAPAGIRDLRLRHAVFHQLRDDFFPVHASYYRNSVLKVKRQTDLNIGQPPSMIPDERTPFGKRLYAAREQAGLTQEQAAKLAGMSQGTLAEAEISGKRSGYTSQLAVIYSVDPVWLATGRGKPRPTGSVMVAEAPATYKAEEAAPDGEYELFARMLALQASLLALIRTVPYTPNLPPVLEQELARARDIMAANPIDEASLSAFDNQAEAIRLSADIHHSRRP